MLNTRTPSGYCIALMLRPILYQVRISPHLSDLPFFDSGVADCAPFFFFFFPSAANSTVNTLFFVAPATFPLTSFIHNGIVGCFCCIRRSTCTPVDLYTR